MRPSLLKSGALVLTQIESLCITNLIKRFKYEQLKLLFVMPNALSRGNKEFVNPSISVK